MTFDPFLVRRLALEHGLDPTLLAGLVQVESRGEPLALRTEARYLLNPVLLREAGAFSAAHGQIPSRLTETTLRACSFGLLQILGQVAREQGFAARWLTALLDPVTNLRLGCQMLTQRLPRFSGNLDWLIASWNAGPGVTWPPPNMGYVQKVRAAMAAL